ncbi:6741_t:CDS:2 [Cetraspora pellucida]|uniref:6741_t:CDS:1 n=1 Tax=Cetraspora pellucida TaxID=1433469 RepID=A0A9N9HHP5_9GLOM|nr:6741_t:CDS:2 [Cetraspora pellucida]
MNKTILENNHKSRNGNSVISRIIKQVSNKKIQISFHQLLKIVKPEIQQDIINSIANPDISRRNRILCKAKRKKKFFNDTTSEFSSLSLSGSSYEWSNDEDFAINMVKTKKCAGVYKVFPMVLTNNIIS